MITLTFRYREEEDGCLKEAIGKLQKMRGSPYYDRSESQIVREIFVTAFRREMKKYLPASNRRKLRLI